jgi:serine/threonine-protein kinase HipA
MTVDPCKLTTMWVWYLADPAAPVRVGSVSLIAGRSRCSFTYDRAWIESGFSLSPDMQIAARPPILPPAEDFVAPGALEDAMPDRWGQNSIRLIERPSRLTSLDFLYFAGDRRSGALGISADPDRYVPFPNDPLVTGSSLEEANEIIQRAINKEPLNERERRLMGTSKHMGGAHPKMLVSIDGHEWLAKFPKGDNVDLPLIEHAATMLARGVGIATPETRSHRIPIGHVVLTKRFDRDGPSRLHSLSARTMLVTDATESYASMAAVIRKHAEAASLAEQQRELFRRMVFNILIDNTDDHTKNHAFLRLPSGKYALAPAYDVLPQMNGLGRQAIPVSARSTEDNFAAAVESSAAFGMSEEEAVAVWRNVSKGVDGWKEEFRARAVTDGDIQYLADFVDSDEKIRLRSDAIVDNLARSGRGFN